MEWRSNTKEQLDWRASSHQTWKCLWSVAITDRWRSAIAIDGETSASRIAKRERKLVGILDVHIDSNQQQDQESILEMEIIPQTLWTANHAIVSVFQSRRFLMLTMPLKIVFLKPQDWSRLSRFALSRQKSQNHHDMLLWWRLDPMQLQQCYHQYTDDLSQGDPLSICPFCCGIASCLGVFAAFPLATSTIASGRAFSHWSRKSVNVN